MTVKEQDYGNNKTFPVAVVNSAEDNDRVNKHVQNKETNHAMKDVCWLL